MKILSLKSLNINSLKGETEIDFEVLTKNSALFAITGATGAGKSTLLDIISCALYGRTARLKNPNDLMSRNFGEAFCEVEFEIRGKKYRSSWSQKRARKKHDGNFQTAKMELTDLDEDKILPLKSKEVPKKIEELSGLDFGRFTQSMLLAQGSFDAFLKADERERSALLEKITGTQIYADISIAIFDKHRTFLQEIDSDQKVLEAITLLDDDVVQEKEKELTENIALKKESDEAIQRVYDALNWQKTVLELQKENTKNEALFKEASQIKEAHKSAFETLALAQKALNVSPTFTSYTDLQNSIEIDKTSITKLGEIVTALDEEINQKDKTYIASQKQFIEEQTKFEIANTELKKARTLQTQEKESHNNLVETQKVQKSKQEASSQLANTLASTIKTFDEIQKQVEHKKAFLKNSAKDEKLESVISLIAQNIEAYKKEQTDLENNQSKLETSGATLLAQEKSYLQQKEEVDDLATIFNEKELAYSKLEQQSQGDIEREEQTQLSLQNTQNLIGSYKQYTKLMQTRELELQTHEKYSSEVEALTQTQLASTQHIEVLKKHIITLREKLENEQRLKKYEEDRKNLIDGEACQLCGATTHPYAKEIDEVPIDKTKALISNQEKELEEREKTLKNVVSKITVTQTKKETSTLEIQKLDAELHSVKAIFLEHAFELTDESELLLKEQEEKLTQILSSVKQTRSKKDEALKEKDSAHKALQNKEKLLHETERALEKLTTQKEQFQKELKTSESNIQASITSLKSHIEPFGLKLDIENVETQYSELVQRNKLYQERSKELKALEIELNQCNVDKKECETEASLLSKELENIEVKVKELEQNITNLSEQRVAILNVADLEVYEQEIAAYYNKIVENKQQLETALNGLKIQRQEKANNKKALELKREEDTNKLNALKTKLETLYQENGFTNEEAFQKASLEQHERETLETQCKTIDENYQQAQTRKIETENKLQIHLKEPLTDKSVEELETLQALLKQKADALQERIGSDKKELALNQENSDKHKESMATLEKKKASFKVWVKLNEMVGSADGTKFKKFAQGITLDQLIYLANQHLSILSRRYTLARNQDKLLELEIIDAYQGNVIRPVSTLSGGESFIVSLALALGLSELASQKIAIDSLFLDEGFGTLDEESLEIALNALNLLQSGGKMVGVISHVEALKERIPLQIKVVPNGDGTSFVEILN
jgi:DNA repair protein SbcC/Rad50